MADLLPIPIPTLDFNFDLKSDSDVYSKVREEEKGSPSKSERLDSTLLEECTHASIINSFVIIVLEFRTDTVTSAFAIAIVRGSELLSLNQLAILRSPFLSLGFDFDLGLGVALRPNSGRVDEDSEEGR